MPLLVTIVPNETTSLSGLRIIVELNLTWNLHIGYPCIHIFFSVVKCTIIMVEHVDSVGFGVGYVGLDLSYVFIASWGVVFRFSFGKGGLLRLHYD
jgi:hypothetical protein